MATPREREREAPSPTVPIIVLVIVVIMLTLRSMTSYDPDYWKVQMVEVETRYIVGAFLIPILLTLVVHSFGIPKVSPIDQTRSNRAVDAAAQDVMGTLVLVGVVVSLFMIIPLRSMLLAA